MSKKSDKNNSPFFFVCVSSVFRVNTTPVRLSLCGSYEHINEKNTIKIEKTHTTPQNYFQVPLFE